MTKARDRWVDIVKIYACILVVLGHLFQSFVSSGILPHTHLYGWFNQSIYYFHVPLFFICSGFLYQKYSIVRTPKQWGELVSRKLLALGVPYLVFSVATWLLKIIFSDQVNMKANGLIETLFLKPLSPYWYLYALFLLFVFSFSIKNKKDLTVMVSVSAAMKMISFFWVSDIVAVRYILENHIWFVLGIVLSYCDISEKINRIKSIYLILSGAAFVALSVAVYKYAIGSKPVAFAMGCIACFATISLAIKFEKDNKFVAFAAKYTMPVFLMHTIFAAGLRSVIFKLGVTDGIIHMIAGIAISFAGPVLAAMIMSKSSALEFFLYPNKILRKRRNKNVKKA